MTKKMMELSIAVFFVVISVCLILLVIFAKSSMDRYVEIAQIQLEQQQEIIASAKETKDLVLEGIGAVIARGFEQEGLMSPTDANMIVSEAIEKFDRKSRKLGTFARAFNEAYLKNVSQ